MITDNFVIFKHFPVRGYWEVSGAMYTTYLMDDMVLSENTYGLDTLLHIHGIQETKELVKDLKRFTKDPQSDMFIVEIK